MDIEIINRFKELLDKGQSYTYSNYSQKSKHGNTASINSDYIGWKTSVANSILHQFGNGSPIYEMYKRSDKIELIGYGQDKFELAHKIILGSIMSAIDLIQNDPNIKSNDNVVYYNDKVFIVHGHDENLKNQTELFLKEIGVESIVLHRQADEGQTIIEKFEKHSQVGYAFILITPDDKAYSITEESLPDNQRKNEKRARQNVIFELGYFIAKLGRKRVCTLYKKGTTLPSDISGLIYKEITNTVEEVSLQIIRDLKAVGFKLKY